MNFKQAVLNTVVESRTENGMKAIASTLRNTTDLFFKIGASRGKDITRDFERAYQEDADLAVRIALWSRDARGGAGERVRSGQREADTSGDKQVTSSVITVVV